MRRYHYGSPRFDSPWLRDELDFHPDLEAIYLAYAEHLREAVIQVATQPIDDVPKVYYQRLQHAVCCLLQARDEVELHGIQPFALVLPTSEQLFEQIAKEVSAVVPEEYVHSLIDEVRPHSSLSFLNMPAYEYQEPVREGDDLTHVPTTSAQFGDFTLLAESEKEQITPMYINETIVIGGVPVTLATVRQQQTYFIGLERGYPIGATVVIHGSPIATVFTIAPSDGGYVELKVLG